MARRFHSNMKVKENFSADSNLPTEIIRQELGQNHSMMTGVNDLYSAVQEQITEDNRDLGKYKTDRKY